MDDQSGQSMIFTSLVIFAMVVMCGVIVGIGEVASDQVRVQHAADSAAYAAASTQANILSQIAWINESVAKVYGECMKDVLSNIQKKTMDSLNVAWFDPSECHPGLPELPEETKSIFSIPKDDLCEYIQDPNRGRCNCHSTWSDTGREWYRNLLITQYYIANLAPLIITNQAYHTAHANYLQDKPSYGNIREKPLRIATYPPLGDTNNPIWSFYPEPGGFHEIVIEHNPQEYPPESIGCRITGTTEPEKDCSLVAMHMIVNAVSGSRTHNRWHVEYINLRDNLHYNLFVDSKEYEPAISESGLQNLKRYQEAEKYLLSTHELEFNDGERYTVSVYVLSPNSMDVVIADVSTPEGRFLVEYVENGVYINGVFSGSENGITYSDGKPVKDTVSINGKEIPVELPKYLDGISLNLPLTLFIPENNPKLQLYFAGKNNASGRISYWFSRHIGWVSVTSSDLATSGEDVLTRVKNLSTDRPSRKWTTVPYNLGRGMHRLFSDLPYSGGEIEEAEALLDVLTTGKSNNYTDEELAQSDMFNRISRTLEIEKGLGELSPDEKAKCIEELTGILRYRRYRYQISLGIGDLRKMDIRKLSWRAFSQDYADDASSELGRFFRTGYVPIKASPKNYDDSPFPNHWRSDDEMWSDFEDRDGKDRLVWKTLADNGLLWATPQRDPQNYSVQSAESYNEKHSFGGWFDIDNGRLHSPVSYSLTMKESPYKQIAMKNKHLFSTSGWKITKDNKLWGYYKNKLSEIGEQEAFDELTEIDLDDVDDEVKFSCGFYVFDGPHSRGVAMDKVKALNDEYQNARNQHYDKASLDDFEDAAAFYPDASIKLSLPFFTYQVKDGGWYIAFYDPFGALICFDNNPKYPGNSPFYTGAITAEAMKDAIRETPAMVRRYAYHGVDLYANPQLCFSFDVDNKRVLHGMGLDPLEVLADPSNDKSEQLQPLEASYQIFRRPIVVCVYKPQSIGWLARFFGREQAFSGESGQYKGDFIKNPLHVVENNPSVSNNHKWSSGHFAIAAARAFFRTDEGGFATNFSFCEQEGFNDAVEPFSSLNFYHLPSPVFPDGIDNKTRIPLSGFRQLWLESTRNLFEPVWTASLVPIAHSLNISDYEIDGDSIISAPSYLFDVFYRASVNASDKDGWKKNVYEKHDGYSMESRDASRAWNTISSPINRKKHRGNDDVDSINWGAEEMQNITLH